MQLRNTTDSGRAQSLPFWFSAMMRSVSRLRDWAVEPLVGRRAWSDLSTTVVQSAHMHFLFPEGDGRFPARESVRGGGYASAPSWTPSARLVSYFGEAPGAENEPPVSGPVLVMPPAKDPKRPHRWLQRIGLVVVVLFCLEIGILLTVLPWTRLWTDNSLLLPFPAIKEFVSYPFVRGLVSGLGLVDIWMGVVEAVTYRETPRS